MRGPRSASYSEAVTTQDIESDYNQCICNAEPRPAVNCDDSNPCTVDGCNSEFGCTYDAAAANGDACDDGDPGTTGDVCTDGVCAGTPAVPCPCWTEAELDMVADGNTDRCDLSAGLESYMEGQDAATGDFEFASAYPEPSNPAVLNCEFYERGLPFPFPRFALGITSAEHQACYSSIAAECADRGF